MRIRLACAAALASVVGACTNGANCTTQGTFGISLVVRDEISSAPICDATFELRRTGPGPALLDTGLRPVAANGVYPCKYIGLLDTAGTFDVVVSRSGYASKTLHVAVYDDDGCGHVTPYVGDTTLAPMPTVDGGLADAAGGP